MKNMKYKEVQGRTRKNEKNVRCKGKRPWKKEKTHSSTVFAAPAAAALASLSALSVAAVTAAAGPWLHEFTNLQAFLVSSSLLNQRTQWNDKKQW